MIPKPLDKITDVELRDVLQNIQEEASGQYLVLTGVPTAGTPLLSEGERGIFNNIIYIRRNGLIQVITPSSTITIT